MQISETTDSHTGYSAQNIGRVQKVGVRENYVTSYKLLAHSSERLGLKTANRTALWVKSKKPF